jgi:hypothetical protein
MFGSNPDLVRRCRDSTEFGTMSDSLVCTECTEGRLTPFSKEAGSDWVCCTCYSSQGHGAVTNTINKWWNEIDAAPKYDVRSLLLLLEEVVKVFDGRHYYAMEVKRRVLENIGESKGFEYDDLAPAWLEKKVAFCREHLALQQVLAPGLSEYRAYISSHIAEPLYLLAKKRFGGTRCNIYFCAMFCEPSAASRSGMWRASRAWRSCSRRWRRWRGTS